MPGTVKWPIDICIDDQLTDSLLPVINVGMWGAGAGESKRAWHLTLSEFHADSTFSSFVTLEKLSRFSKLLFPHLKNKDDNIILLLQSIS